MIRIEDKDSPIVVAEKIVTATVTYTPTPLQKAMAAAMLEKQEEEAETDMFSVEEIREIADYITRHTQRRQNPQSCRTW